MKFGKEFSRQLVPEWTEAYMDYNALKAILKDILHMKKQMVSLEAAGSAQSSLNRKATFYRAFSGLTSRHNSRRNSSVVNEDEAVLVHAVDNGESESGEYAQTMLLSYGEGGEKEIMFFRKLDQEFNKVVKFYKDKVQELMNQAEDFNKQMDAFIALRIKVHEPGLQLSEHDRKILHSAVPPSENGIQHLVTIYEDAANNRHGHKGVNRGDKMASVDVLDRVTINTGPKTPFSSLKGFMMRLKSNSSLDKEELMKVEQLMKKALIAFHHQLRLLKSYSFLNQLAFSKIVKKYDKITSRNASKAYLDMVDKSYLSSSDEVTRMLERVETTFIKHFSNGNRRKGMQVLRPQKRREKHRLTFFLGFFAGCAIALVVALIILIHTRHILNSEGRTQYMENVFPLYSFFGFIVLHMLAYSANIFFWRRYRINYQFIFGFKEGTELGYKEVFLLSSILAVGSLAAVLSNLNMEIDPRTKSYGVFTELVPLASIIVLLLIIFCPFDIIYRSSRFFLIRCAVHCIFTPFYKVTLPDFFLADQLTSQVQAFRSFEFYICYYIWGDLKKRSQRCNQSHVYEAFYFIVAVIPYWMRFIQCLRRLVEEKDVMHGVNGLKYLSTIIAVIMRTTHDLKPILVWKVMAAVTSAIAAIGSTYWDVVIDWGLMRRNSRNPWLRDKLLVPKKSVYFVAMILNVILRLAWMQSVLGFTEAPFLHKKALSAFVACLEIVRRGIWNFFRLENEHLNNVGKYRAFKSVPLPFNYDEEDKDL